MFTHAVLQLIVREVEDPANAYVVGVLATTQMMARDRGFVDVFQRPSAEDDLKLEVAGAVATLSINRPQARNALALATMAELDEALETLRTARAPP